MIKLHEVNFAYKSKKPVFNDLNLELEPGSIYGLLGKNGAGKSTLLKVMSGLLFPHKGTITCFNLPVMERSPELLQDLFLVPEDFELPPVSIQTFVKCTAPFYLGYNENQFRNYLQEFQIPENSKLTSLSYGQKKKFLLAFAFATNTKIIILDEPTNGLDIPSKIQFRKIVAAAMDENKIMVISTHQVRDLENLIEAVIVLESGKIIFNQHINEISERLVFSKDLSDIQGAEIIFRSNNITGAGITENLSGIEGKVDYEILFEAALHNSQHLNQYFKNK